MKKIAIFASGNGSNAENIARYFDNKSDAQVSRILTNKPTAFVLERAKNCGIPSTVFSREQLHNGEVLARLEEEKIDWIVLAGFLWLMPQAIVKRYSGKMINIHPSLLPKFGGKGMYGDKVHQAVIDHGEIVSGITIHLVNEEYDKGEILFQAEVEVTPDDSAASLAAKIHQLEYRHFPEVIERTLAKDYS